MFNRTDLTACNYARRKGASVRVRRSPVNGSVYPTVPAAWPNRAVRRALRYGEHRLPGEWRVFLTQKPEFRRAALGLA